MKTANMSTLIYIAALGVMAYNCMANYNDFKGASSTIKTVFGLGGSVGYTVYYITLVWSFWHFAWWQPIVAYVATLIIGGVSAVFFQRNYIGMMLCPVLIVVFSILSIAKLILM